MMHCFHLPENLSTRVPDMTQVGKNSSFAARYQRIVPQNTLLKNYQNRLISGKKNYIRYLLHYGSIF